MYRTLGHATPPALAATDASFLVVLGVAGIVSAALTGAALATFLRRRSVSYLLVACALAALLARTGVGIATIALVVDPTTHHFLEHALDVAMAALVIAAVYFARTVDRSEGWEP